MQKILMQVKFLKNRNRKNNLNIKIIRNFLSRSKNVQKRITFSSLILKHKNNIKKPGMLLKKQWGKRDVITKTFIQKKSY